jgi:hypothetical protein
MEQPRLAQLETPQQGRGFTLMELIVAATIQYHPYFNGVAAGASNDRRRERKKRFLLGATGKSGMRFDRY